MLTDEQIDAITVNQWGDVMPGVMFQAHRAYARAILAASPATPAPSQPVPAVQPAIGEIGELCGLPDSIDRAMAFETQDRSVFECEFKRDSRDPSQAKTFDIFLSGYLAASQPSGAVGGSLSVPSITDEMLKAGQEAVWDFHPDRTIEENERVATAAFSAMSAASPAAALTVPAVPSGEQLYVNETTRSEFRGFQAARASASVAAPLSEPVAWLIAYTSEFGERRTSVHGHNAVGDYRSFDPSATSEPLYQRPAAQPNTAHIEAMMEAKEALIDARAAFEAWVIGTRKIDAEIAKLEAALALLEKQE